MRLSFLFILLFTKKTVHKKTNKKSAEDEKEYEHGLTTMCFIAGKTYTPEAVGMGRLSVIV